MVTQRVVVVLFWSIVEKFTKINDTGIKRKFNNYDLTGSFGIGYVPKGEEFYFDLEDYDIVKNWYWRKLAKRGDINKGYWMTNTKDDDQYNTSVIFLHQVMEKLNMEPMIETLFLQIICQEIQMIIEKCNLKLKTNEENCHNRGLSKANTSGKTGVSFNKQKGLWTAYITINYKTIHLGDFIDINEAIDVMKGSRKRNMVLL